MKRVNSLKCRDKNKKKKSSTNDRSKDPVGRGCKSVQISERRLERLSYRA